MKWFVYGVPIVILAICVLVMTSGNWLKQPLRGDDDVLALVREVERLSEGEQWEEARAKALAAHQAWHHVVNRIQFSVEREMMMEISGTLAKIQGAVRAEDTAAVLQEIHYFYELWSNLAE
ncbi:MAG: hypothetical protein A6D91_00440 [Bacillaceae bacterium G1]|nr:MAG: hypothetical protein A6D91_00440 [Bacillaceae bacterium G1]